MKVALVDRLLRQALLEGSNVRLCQNAPRCDWDHEANGPNPNCRMCLVVNPRLDLRSAAEIVAAQERLQ